MTLDDDAIAPGSESDARERLRIRVAVHYLGCAETVGDGIGVASRAGPFLECLADMVDRVTVVAYLPPGGLPWEEETEYVVRRPNVDVLSLGPIGTWRSFLSRRRRVARIIELESERWDVLVMYFLPHRRAMLVSGPNRCPRVVAHVVATTASADPGRRATLIRTLGRRAVDVLTRTSETLQLRAVLRRARAVIVNSEELRHWVGRQPGQVTTVPLSARRAHQVFEARDRFDRPEINILIAGRMTLEKGPLIALEAFAAVKRDVPNARLHIVGTGPALDAVLGRATELRVRDDIVVHGWIAPGDALFGLYKDMDVFLFPSYAAYEGFPQIIWETMAHSVLVVCTPVRGAREALEHERDVLFVPMKDPAAMAEAVRQLAGDPELRRRLLASAFEKARSTSIDHTVRGFVAAMTGSWPELADKAST